MRIKALLAILLFALSAQQAYSQVLISTSVPDSISYWEKSNIVGLDLNQAAFVNWSIGGNNSVAILAKGSFLRKYTKGNINWANELLIKYGLNSQEGQELRKTDDQIQLNSTFGYRTDSLSNWYYSAKFNFNTQFTAGYAYPNTEVAISGPFSPAYVFLGVGSEYIRKDVGLTAYFSPLTAKATFVFNNRLADAGAFGVEPALYDEAGNKIRSGKNMRTEVGMLVTNQIKRQLFKNIMLDHRIALYTDYLNNFGNIDVNWQVMLDLVVNEYVKASIGAHMIYDDDIKATEEIDGEVVKVGPKIQLQQTLAVGVTYSF